MAVAAPEERQIGEKGPFGRVWDGEKFVKRITRAPSPAPAAPAATAATDLAALIRDSVAAAMAPLERKIADLENRPAVGAPAFKSMDPSLGKEFGQFERQAIKTLKKGESMAEERTLPVGTNSHVLSNEVLSMVPQRFQPGQTVQIKRDVVRAHMKHDLSWGELLDGLGVVRCPTKHGANQCRGRMKVGEACPICGEGPKVLKIGFLNETVGDWVLKVRVPGLTTSYGMGFYSQELEAA